MNRVIILVCGLALWSSEINAQQDKHFSMFYANPVQLNPGAAGHFEGDLQIFTNYRSQWFTLSSKPYSSFSASLDGRLFEKNLNNGFFGAGLNFYRDQSGDGQYTVSIISFPVNYSLELNKYSYLSMGVQAAHYSQQVSDAALYFDNQWDGSGFNTSISSGENIGTTNLSKFDLSSGIYYIAKPKKNLEYKFGLSGHHLTKQKIGFYSLNEKMYRNVTLFGQANFGRTTSKISFQPAAFIFFQGPNREFTVGNTFTFEIKPPSVHTLFFDGQSLSLGIYYRSTDAFIINMGYRAGAMTLGVSYDMNLSGLTVATGGVGAFEMYLAFRPEFRTGFGAPRIR